ncbi:FABP family protein [Brevibacterium daeguense]|uniref:FABP family protein n=1 Tax=Brevibacterium daeguense TaxID=909936 RepID=A0ABP8EMF6_9MICO|nr:FABP family protein [Brevibacterium daeguense]
MSTHPNLAPAAAIIGVWRGPGRGEYPTIEPFSYTEELTFTDVGKPFLHYLQRTWSPAGQPMHTETGYLRVPEADRAEFVLALPTGQTELAEGTLSRAADGFELRLSSRVMNSATAKHVTSTERVYRLSGDTLSVDFAMAAVGEPMTHHLHADLTRQPPPGPEA